ncbi:MAG: hypothetical protein EPO67_07585 [Reyranella sp.]|nr:MAG: hypothetical protein EPO67_07585 [Reyranella sp.]
MCDYSLELYRSRPAVEGEQYTLRRFPSGTMGFTAARDCETAVCLPADAHLRLEGIGEAIRQAYVVNSTEEVVTTRMDGTAFSHRDAVRFANGREVLLQGLNAGTVATLIEALPEAEGLSEVRAQRELVDA